VSSTAEDSRLARISREMLFSGMTEDATPGWALDRAIGLLEEEALRAGHPLFSRGHPADYVSFIRDASFEAVAPDAPPWRFEGSWLVGVFDAVMQRPHARSILLSSDAHVLRIRSDDWLELLEDCFELTYSLLLRAVQNTAAIEDRLEARGPQPLAPNVDRLTWEADSLSLVERLALLVDVPLLRGAGVQTLADLAAHAEEHRYAAGELVLPLGQARDRQFLVVAGEVVGRRAPRAQVRRYGVGDVVLGTAAFGQASRAWEVRAAAPTRALSFAERDWLELMEQHFDMARSAFAWVGSERERLLNALSAAGESTFRLEPGSAAGEV
jgi:CRP-like cAMP-binding protein